MSVPYGQSPAASQPGPASRSGGGLDLGKILAISTGGLGLVIYFLSFSDDVGGYLRGLTGVLLLGGGLLAAAGALPKTPATLVPAAVTVVTGTLFLLIEVAKGSSSLGPFGAAVPGLAIVALVLAFLESVAAALALLVSVGLVNMAPRPRPVPQQSWAPLQSGGYSAPTAQGGYPGGYPTYGGYPEQGGYPGQGSYPGPGSYPGQYQQPAGPPSGGYPVQPPQPYLPGTVQYRGVEEQYSQPEYGGQPGQGQYGAQPQGQYSGDEAGRGSAEHGESERPPEFGERPGSPPGSPGQG